MQILYIVREDDKFPVWNHKLRAWSRDYDAYYGDDFNYRSMDSARFRLKEIRKASKHYNGTEKEIPGLRIVTREQLFDIIGVKDWAGERWDY